jgi:hypothetical protein
MSVFGDSNYVYVPPPPPMTCSEYRARNNLPRPAESYQIEDMQFWWLGMTNVPGKEHRPLLYLECSGHPLPIPFYKSNSGMGLWRLYGGSFYKGQYDYVQSNLMFIELQIWINPYLSRLPVLPYESFEECNSDDAYGHIDRDTINKYLRTPVEQAEAMYLFETYEPGKKVKEYLSLLHGCGHLERHPHLEQNESKLSALMQKVYRMGEQRAMGTMNSRDEFEGIHVTYHQEIFKVELQSNVPHLFPEVTLYYSIYDMDYRRGDIHVECKRYHIPLFLGEDRCTTFGVFSKLLTIGSYVCKVWEYNKQVPASIVDAYQLSAHYTFIGHLFDGLYPFPKVHGATFTTNQLNPELNPFGFPKKIASKEGRRIIKKSKKIVRKRKNKSLRR